MATDKPTITQFNIETLNTLGAQCFDHADTMKALGTVFLAVAGALNTAANVTARLAHLRFEIGEAITHTKDPDIARELRDALEDAAKPVEV
jgi:hypothetical protein